MSPAPSDPFDSPQRPLDDPYYQGRRWLVPRDKPGLLVAMMRALAGDAHISFEGDLSHCDFSAVLGGTAAETEALRRKCFEPILDFVVLPLELQTIRPISDQILPKARVVHDIIHVQIEKRGTLQFGACDNFDPECVVCWSDIPNSLLDQLVESGVLRSHRPAPPGEHRWHD